MPYYNTLAEDLERAEAILREGKLSLADLVEQMPVLSPELQQQMIDQSGTIYGKDIYAAYKLLESFVAELKPRVAEPVCSRCHGPHPYDTSIPSVVWNAVVRAQNLPEFLCATCIIEVFVEQGQSFTATLWGGSMSGAAIEVRVNGQEARDAALILEENTRLRAEASVLRYELQRYE